MRANITTAVMILAILLCVVFWLWLVVGALLGRHQRVPAEQKIESEWHGEVMWMMYTKDPTRHPDAFPDWAKTPAEQHVESSYHGGSKW